MPYGNTLAAAEAIAVLRELLGKEAKDVLVLVALADAYSSRAITVVPCRT